MATYTAHDDLSDLTRMFHRQLENLTLPIGARDRVPDEVFVRAARSAMESFSSVLGWENAFSPLNSMQYSMFLYILSRHVYEELGDRELASRIFLLNKALNGIDLFYEVELPKRFLIGHSVGIVFAKAKYGEDCIFHQGCTVGRIQSDRPELGDGVVMFPGSSIIGRSKVGRNAVISAGVTVINKDVPENSLVFDGGGGQLIFKETDEIFSRRYFRPRVCA